MCSFFYTAHKKNLLLLFLLLIYINAQARLVLVCRSR